MAVLAWRAGACVLRLFEPRRPLEIGRSLTAFAIGFALLGTLFLGLGLTGLIFAPPRPLSVVLLAALALHAGWRARNEARALGDWATGLFHSISLPAGLLLAVGLIVTAAGIFNVEMSWDALSYHLRLPSFYLYRHKIFDVWHHYCFPFPSLIELIYALGLAVQGDQAARLLNVAFGFLLLGTIRPMARSLGAGGRLATLMILASPLFLMLLIRAYIDLGFSLFFALSLLHLLGWGLRRSRSSLVLSALMAGAAMSGKYVGVLVLPALLAAAGYRLLRPSLRPALLWCAAAFLPLAPWLVKNYLFEANPVSPMLGALFGVVEERSPDIVPFFESGRSFISLAAALPLRVTHLLFDDGRIDGPLVVCMGAALPLLVFAGTTRSRRFLLRAVLGYAAAWLLLCPDARFFLPVAIALCLLLETPLLDLLSRSRSLRILIEAGLAAGALFAAANQWIFFGPLSMPLGLETTKDRLAIGLPPPPFNYYATRFINENVPEDARIMYLCHFSTYYIQRECVAEFRFGRSKIARIIEEGRTPERIGVKLRQRGVRWLLHSRHGTAPYVRRRGFFEVPPGGWKAFRDLLARRAEAVWQTEGFVLFRLGPEHEPRPLPVLPVYESLVFDEADRLLASGEARKALRAFAAPPPLLRDVASTFVRQADAHLALEEAGPAKDHFLRALSLGGDHYRIRVGLAQIYLRLGRPDRALPHADKARVFNPLSGYAAATLALVHSGLGNIPEARRQMEEAARLAPHRPRYRELAEHLGEREKAEP